MSKTNVRLDRLRKVVQALREVPCEQKSQFTMGRFVHNCGTPACALGHFAARRDLQRGFKIVPRKGPFDSPIHEAVTEDGDWEVLAGAREYFNLSSEQGIDLFGIGGCNGAKTPAEAASYIERFINRIEKEQSK